MIAVETGMNIHFRLRAADGWSRCDSKSAEQKTRAQPSAWWTRRFITFALLIWCPCLMCTVVAQQRLWDAATDGGKINNNFFWGRRPRDDCVTSSYPLNTDASFSPCGKSSVHQKRSAWSAGEGLTNVFLMHTQMLNVYNRNPQIHVRICTFHPKTCRCVVTFLTSRCVATVSTSCWICIY